MASKRRVKRRREKALQERAARQCVGKLRYPNEFSAKVAAREVGRIKNTVLQYYRCPVCSRSGDEGWHIGHDPAIKRSKLRAQTAVT